MKRVYLDQGQQHWKAYNLKSVGQDNAKFNDDDEK